MGKIRFNKVAFSSYQNYNNNVLQHLSKEVFFGLENLRTNKNIVIQGFKGNSVVIVDKADYLDKMVNLLKMTWKFEKFNLKNDGTLYFAANQEKRVDKILKIFLHLIAYLMEQGELLNKLGLGQV